MQFVDPYDAGEAQYHINGQLFCDREITVVVVAETRKSLKEMHYRGRPTRAFRLWRWWNATLLWEFPFSFIVSLTSIWFKRQIQLKIKLSCSKKES